MKNSEKALKLVNYLWPDLRLFRQQREILISVFENDETYVVAANMMGKDFIASIICLIYFLLHHPCRIITTSVKDEHLDVLWGEIDNRLHQSAISLEKDHGGPLFYTHHEIRKVIKGRLDQYSYLKGLVSRKGEGLSGHHAPYTLLVVDEASGVDDQVYQYASTWAKRMLIFGNAWECNNFFRRAVTGDPLTGEPGGDLKRDGFTRRVFRITAEQSPNVRLALLQKKKGLTPTGEVLIPGILTWEEYQKRRAFWDPIRQAVGLDATFYEGQEIKFFPSEWLQVSVETARKLKYAKRYAEAIGIDTGEGTSYTAICVIDRLGIIDLISKQTPDTSEIVGLIIGIGNRYSVPPERWVFDRGGGGKEHADRLRALGYTVRTVGFGETVHPPLIRGSRLFSQRLEAQEISYVYRNRRVALYDQFRQLLNPSRGTVFAIPEIYTELLRQLKAIPLMYDQEGRMLLPPKNRSDGKTSSQKSLMEIIGRSPDELDSLVLAVDGLLHRTVRRVAEVL